MKYLLDTDTCIYLINNHPAQVRAKFAAHRIAEVGISSITCAELEFGVHKSGSRKNLDALTKFLLPFGIAAFDAVAAARYGVVRAALEKKGSVIGPLDTLIAAHALALGAVLVTNNVREFKRVAGLKVENWVAG